MKVKRRKIEGQSILIAFISIIALVLLSIIAIADEIFGWNILPPGGEKIVTLVMSSIGIVIAACFLLNLMVNFSLISISAEKIAEQKEKQNG